MTKEELKDMLNAYGAVSVRYHEQAKKVRSEGENERKDPECRRLRARRQELRDTILKEFESLN